MFVVPQGTLDCKENTFSDGTCLFSGNARAEFPSRGRQVFQSGLNLQEALSPAFFSWTSPSGLGRRQGTSGRFAASCCLRQH